MDQHRQRMQVLATTPGLKDRDRWIGRVAPTRISIDDVWIFSMSMRKIPKDAHAGE